MPKPVLKTRLVGQATHYSRHPLAPPELVYTCHEPARPPLPIRLLEAAIMIAGPIWFGFLVWKVIEKAL